MTIRSDTSFTS